MIPTQNDMRILFEGKSDEYIDLYREEIDDFLKPDEDEVESGEFNDFSEVESLDAEELFEILFTIPMTVDDDYCEVVNILADEFLPYDVDADFEDKKLVVFVDENKHVINSEDGYTILRKFDEIIKPEYEIRVMKLSLDEDNVHSLVILESDEWENLETKYGAKVAGYFEKIDNINFK
jgi:hypothetical protein